LFGHAPTYDHVKVFGCLAFATPSFREIDKFQPRGIPCVFLGYSATQKGYKLLSLLNNKIRVYRDVIFEESIFPFHKDSLQAYMQPTHVNMVPQFYDDDLCFPVVSPPADIPVPEREHSVFEHEHSVPSGSHDSSVASLSPRRTIRAVKKRAWLSDYVTAAVISQGKIVYPAAN